MTDDYIPQKGLKLNPEEVVSWWLEAGLLAEEDLYVHAGDEYICPYCNVWDRKYCNGGSVKTSDGWIIACQCRIRYYFSEKAKQWNAESHVINHAYAHWRLADWKKGAALKVKHKILPTVEHFIEHRTGSLVLTGPPGTGKTSLAVAIRNELSDRNIPSMWLTVEELTTEITATWRKRDGAWQEKRELIESAPVLFLDDMGKTGLESTAGIKGEFFGIINKRYNYGRPTVVTSNLSLKELEDMTNAVIDRLLDRHDGTLADRHLSFGDAASFRKRD